MWPVARYVLVGFLAFSLGARSSFYHLESSCLPRLIPLLVHLLGRNKPDKLVMGARGKVWHKFHHILRPHLLYGVQLT